MSESPDSTNIDQCITILNSLCQDGEKLALLSEQQRIELIAAAGRLSRPDRDEARRRTRANARVKRQAEYQHERKARALTGIRTARENSVFVAPPRLLEQAGKDPERILKSARNCYVCKDKFVQLHHFYDALCPSCAEFNYQKRFQTTSLRDQVVVITGARLKIGYQATLMMLRAGARVIATTRFPVDAARRFAGEPDFSEWRDRLEVYGLDLRHTPSVDIFCRHLEQKLDRLDILINNAAQTVRRPPGFYAHLLANENAPWSQQPEGVRSLLTPFRDVREHLTQLCPASETATPMVGWNDRGPAIGLRASAMLSQLPYSYDSSLVSQEVFPTGRLDADLQQVDLRETNSWRLKLQEVPVPEMLEVQLVNAVAPFVLCSKLLPLMRKQNTGCKHIVNVTAMEGKFYRFTKPDRHPHTNMAKAALNMLTHTSASDLAQDGIFMNAVDTGWVTDEDPAQMTAEKQKTHDFQPPLDIVDGAARICDPFFHGILSGKHWSGKFLKDYFPIDW